MSTDLAAFLHARITEDEEAARRWREDEHEWQVVGRRHLTYQSGSGENVAAIDVTNQPCMWWERIYVKGDVGDLAAPAPSSPPSPAASTPPPASSDCGSSNTGIDDLETVITAMHHNPTLWPPHPDTHTHEQEPTP